MVGMPARWNIGSEFRYSPPPLDEKTLVIAVTQSGETADTLAPTRLARERGCPVIAVTNTVGSAITREADAVMFLQAGPEMAVVATKTFVTQVTTLILLSAAIARARGVLTDDAERELVAALRALPAQAERALKITDEAAERLASRYLDARGFMFVGRGVTYPVALEGALKLKELAYMHAEGFAAGELKHGPIALIEEGLPVIVVMPSPKGSALLHSKLLSNIREIQARGAVTIVIAEEGDETVRPYADHLIEIPAVSTLFQPLLSTVPLQVFAAAVARARGYDVDKPRNLAKSVTVE
jgi:glucosamine--fructose-6-phosphate aminotransferase (isomerizing)